MKISNEVMAEYCEMHSSLRDTMRIARWAGMFPVEGLDRRDIGKLRFNLKSFYIVYHISSIILQTLITGIIFNWFLINDLRLDTLSFLVFYVTGLGTAVLLLKLAYDWPKLIRLAAKIEKSIIPIRVSKIGVSKTCNTITYIVLTCATIEHLLSLIYKIKNVMLCRSQDDIFSESFLENYFDYTFPYIIGYLPISYVVIGISSLANLQATFLWNITDVMTMCFSIYLIKYFKDLNTLMSSQRNDKTQDWEQLRIYYSRLVALVQAVDSKMCYLILLAILTNLFFICQQLYYTLNSSYIINANCAPILLQEKRYIDKGINLFYFTYSFLFLIIRATTMLLLAANINTASMVPLYTLTLVPSADYSIHVQRFNRQLTYTTTAVSGVFFYVTRKMILRVFATILTYELVLFQFDK